MNEDDYNLLFIHMYGTFLVLMHNNFEHKILNNNIIYYPSLYK
jgi:hypothetical protein